MPEQKTDGCVKAARGPIMPASGSTAPTSGATKNQQEVSEMMALVSKVWKVWKPQAIKAAAYHVG